MNELLSSMVESHIVHCECYESIARSLYSVNAEMRKSESRLMSAMDSMGLDFLENGNGDQATIVRGADGKRRIVAVKAKA